MAKNKKRCLKSPFQNSGSAADQSCTLRVCTLVLIIYVMLEIYWCYTVRYNYIGTSRELWKIHSWWYLVFKSINYVHGVLKLSTNSSVDRWTLLPLTLSVHAQGL